MIVYNLGIRIFYLILKLSSYLNPKAKQWIEGRENWKNELQEKVNHLKLNSPIWFHCASLGEFEQGRPVIEKIKQIYPQQKVLITFFSPSGYEIQKNYPLADLIIYLPLDTSTNANDFLSIVKPKMAIFIKYEFWLNFLFELKKNSISVFLISAVIKKHQPFFKWYGSHFRKALAIYKNIYTQDEHSLTLLKSLQINTGLLSGDTRFDRVLQICSSPKKMNEIQDFTNNTFTIIAGSSWPIDEHYLIESYSHLKELHPKLKLIIAPHEIDTKNINRLKNHLSKHNLDFHLFSENIKDHSHSILIIDAIGYLSSIYQYGHIAFIGGGFSNGIHNILEPTVYGLPVLFGPNFKKFNEAFEVIDLNVGFVVNNSLELTHQLNRFINNKDLLNQSSHSAKNYVLKNTGATNKIVNSLATLIEM